MTKTIFNMNKTATGILLAALGAAPSLPGEAAQPKGMRIEHPGINNTLVRIDSTANFLLLPVQESSDDARINLLVDGKIAETIYVRLARSKTDYTVPFDLTPYKGKKLLIDIVTPQGRSSVREAK